MVCGHLGVRRACARWSSSTHGCVRACMPLGRGQRVESAEPTAGPCPCASARRFPRSACEQCPRVGGHVFVLFAAMSPTWEMPRNAAWGTSSGTSTGTGGVHNREHEAGRQAGRCMRANSDMRGGGKLPPPRDLRVRSSLPRGQSWAASSLWANPDSCGGANLAPPRDLGFYRTTDAPLGLFRLWRTNRTTMVLPNWQDHMTWADTPGPRAGLLSSGCR